MSEIKKICVVHICTVPTVFKQFRGQLHYIQNNGYDVHCISSPGQDLIDIGSQEGVQIHPVKMTRTISPIVDLVSVFKIVILLLKIKPSIVHSYTPKGGFLGMLSAFVSLTPVRIYHNLGLRFVLLSGWREKLLIYIEKLSCYMAHKVYCDSKSVREIIVSMSLCPEKKIVVPVNGSVNGVDAEQRFNPLIIPKERSVVRDKYQIPRDAILIGFVGRITIDKGIIELIKAWIVLRREFENLHLFLIGPVEDIGVIPGVELDVFLNDVRIHKTGDITDPVNYYAALDIFASPTRREGFGTTFLEAAAMELPVVATNITGCIDCVIPGETGMLIEVQDEIMLANALREYIINTNLRKQHGSNARKRVIRDFRQEALWEYMVNEYKTLLRRKLQNGK